MFKNLFKTKSFGLDISDDSIKFIKLIKKGNEIKIKSFGEKKIPEGIVEFGEIKDEEKIKEILSTFKKEYKLKSFDLSDILKSKAQTITDAVIKRGDTGTYMIVNVEKKHAGVFVVSNNVVMYVSILNTEGTPISNLCEEIMRHFIFWHTHKDENREKKLPIEKTIVCGSNFDLKKFSEHLSKTMRSKVELANVWVNILNTEKNIPGINFEESLKFASALGVALKKFK